MLIQLSGHMNFKLHMMERCSFKGFVIHVRVRGKDAKFALRMLCITYQLIRQYLTLLFWFFSSFSAE